MAKSVLTTDKVLRDKRYLHIPHVVAYNRLETRPRTLDFTGSLRAEVRDPLWMLTRQWQFGEFQGEDAASPVTSRIAFKHQKIDQVALDDGNPFAFDGATMPLETRVERERIPLTVRELAGGEIFSDILFAVQWGKRFLQMLKDRSMDNHHELYLKKFPVRVLPPAPPPTRSRAVQDPEAEQILISIAGRVADGVAIWRAVENGTHDPWLDTQLGGNNSALKALATAFAAYCSKKFNRLFTQPEDSTDTAWLNNHLEYQFAVRDASVPKELQAVLFAEQYHHGHLDWYSFDTIKSQQLTRNLESAPPVEGEQVESFLPAPVRFKGQPQPRFWEMEETQTDFGKIETSTTGLLHMMLAEFGLIYSNDWYMLPHPMNINTACEIRGIIVDDTFGRHTFIRPAGRGSETLWQRWGMFHHTEKDRQWPSTSRFYLVPAVGKVLESEPLEQINFMRDEMANMVWGVESIVPSQMGKGISGYETARPNGKAEPPTAEDENVRIRYVLGTTVPKNWIPFIPVHSEDSVSEIRLQRARMVGGEPPRGWILREPGSPYFIEEEEVPRTGIYVERSWQRARWIGGKTFIWVGRRKTAGRGEGWSQLVFDQIVDLKLKKTD